MPQSVTTLLRQRTAAIHDRVETHLGLLAPDLTADRMRVVLAGFAGFWQGAERLLDSWAAAHPGAAGALRWPRRRRGEVIRHDLLRLGFTVRDLAAVAEAPPPFAALPPTSAEVLGWLYVSEGSTLGGAVVDRALRAGREPLLVGLRTFTPYVEGPGPMWRGYRDYLDAWVGADAGRREAVAAAAEASFAALERWLAPDRVRRPA